MASDFNILTCDEFLQDINTDDGVEVLAQGIGVEELPTQPLDLNALAIEMNDFNILLPIDQRTDQIDDEEILILSNDLPSDIENIDLTKMGDEEAKTDEHGLSDDDYMAAAELMDQDLNALENVGGGGKENDPNGVTDEFRSRVKRITYFPIRPGGMTLDFCHEWTMIKAGRLVELKDELKRRLQFTYEDIMVEVPKDETGASIPAVTDALLNNKLETYAKLGQDDDVTALLDENEHKVDVCQPDKCQIPLVGRLAIWPCHYSDHQYCRIMSDLIMKMPDKHNDLNLQSRAEGATALMIACTVGDLCKIWAILRNGAFVNLTNHDGKTALMMAAEHGYLDVVNLLLKYGATPMPDKPGLPSAIELAMINDHDEIVSRLNDYYYAMTSSFATLWTKALGAEIVFGAPISDLYCANIRESPTFKIQFMLENDAWKTKEIPNHVNVLIVMCVKLLDDKVHIKLRKGTVIKKVLINGTKAKSVLAKGFTIVNAYAMRNLKPDQPNELEIQFKTNCYKESLARMMVRAYQCDITTIVNRSAQRAAEAANQPKKVTPNKSFCVSQSVDKPKSTSTKSLIPKPIASLQPPFMPEQQEFLLNPEGWVTESPAPLQTDELVSSPLLGDAREELSWGDDDNLFKHLPQLEASAVSTSQQRYASPTPSEDALLIDRVLGQDQRQRDMSIDEDMDNVVINDIRLN